MIRMQPAFTSSGGTVMYPDDRDPQQFYVMPTGLALATGSDGTARFRCIFYQTDFAQRGARLVLALEPIYPPVEPEAAAALGSGARIDGLPFDDALAGIRWFMPGQPADPAARFEGGLLHIEMILTETEAVQMRELLRTGALSGVAEAQIAYSHSIKPTPAGLWINTKQAARYLVAMGDPRCSGFELQRRITLLPEEAIRLSAGPPADLTREALLARHAGPLAQTISQYTADLVGKGLIFDERVFCLRPPEQVDPLEIWLDLSRPRAWQEIWSAEWSISDFYAQVVNEGQLKTYFPEVLHVPVVGDVEVFVENVLTATPDTIQQVRVELKHRKLGSMDEQYQRFDFLPGSSPVASHKIPVIAFIPFAYQYRVQLTLAPELEGSTPEDFPLNPSWVTAGQPVLEVGQSHTPCAVAYVSAQPGIFQHAGRVEIELAGTGDDPPEPLARYELTAARPARWLLVRQLPPTTRAIRWRALFTPSGAAQSSPLAGAWHTEPRPEAALRIDEIIPREPLPVRVTVTKGSTPEVTLVLLELRSGPTADAEPQIRCAFTGDEQRQLYFWPETIFDTGCQYRFGFVFAGGPTHWLAWQPLRGGEIKMQVEDTFYVQRTVRVTLVAPWAAQRSPDPSSSRGEIIFAQVELRALNTAQTQNASVTFDADNQNTEFPWKVRGAPGAEQYEYTVHLLALDGRLLDFGPFRGDRETLALEVIRTSVSDAAPPEFLVRERS